MSYYTAMGLRSRGLKGIDLIAAVIALGALAIVTVVVYPMFARSTPVDGHPSSCISQVKQLALAALMYAGDWDDHLMDRDLWMDQIEPFHKYKSLEHCPALITHEGRKLGQQVYGYAFHSRLHLADALKVEKPESMPLIYDSINLAKNASDRYISLPVPGRHKGRNMVGYLDGHVKSTLTEDRAP